MKKKILYGLLIFIIIVVVINVGVVLVSLLSYEAPEKQPKKIKVVNKLICTFTDKDDFHFTIELNLNNGVLVTKKDTMTWEDKTKEICDFYKKRTETYNSISGIVDTVECNDLEGTRTTIYTIDNVDTVEARIAEMRYINEDKIFDISGYKTYRLNDGYNCKEYE